MKSLALFDFDGTLCTTDSFTGFMRYCFSKPYFYRKCLSIGPQIVGYYAKLYPAHLMRPLLFKQLFQDTDATHSINLGRHYADYLYQNHLNPSVRKQLHWHQQQQHHVAIVSASLDLYLTPLAQRLNTTLICTQIEHHQHHLTGDYATPDCSADQKVIRIKRDFDLTAYEKIYVYGNSVEDYAMLALATDGFWVNKQHQLCNFHQQ